MIPKIPSVERIVHILAIIVDHNLALAAIMRVGSYLIISIFLVIVILDLVLLIRVRHWL